MGTISTGTGLISGLDITSIIDQLIAIETRPRTLVQNRVSVLQSQKAAYLDINAQLLALETQSKTIADPGLFRTKSATSTDESVLTASASKTAAVGSYTFTVDRLVSTHQLISNGFVNKDQQTFGAGTLRFESDKARLDRPVELGDLNGGLGVQRGVIRITDRAGVTADIDLSRAQTLDDVINAINDNVALSVTASIDGDGLAITDTSGATTSNLIVQSVGGRTTAADLGIAGSVAAATITGTQVNSISMDSLFASINDGNGVGAVGAGQNDLSITDDGGTYNVSLDGLNTIQDLADAIDTASAGTISLAVAADGVSLELTGTGAITVAALNGSTAASDLGLLGSGTGTIAGERVVANLGSKLLKNLNGGQGVNLTGAAVGLQRSTALSALFGSTGITTNGDPDSPDIRIQDRTGAEHLIEVDGMSSVGQLIDEVKRVTGGKVQLSIDGNALVATNTSEGTSNFQIEDANGATVASALGITIDSVNGGAESVTGGDTNPGVGTSISITNRAGVTTVVDLASAVSVTDVIDLINDSGAGVTAGLSAAGNGLSLTDTTGSTASNLIVTGVNGSTATELGIGTDAAGVAANTLQGQDTDVAFITAGTRLETLNGGTGVSKGKFTLRDSAGVTSEVDLTQGDEVTLAKVIAEINSRPTAIVATINATGDGILLTDTGPGTVSMKITEAGSTTARDLGILGEDTDGDGRIVGSFERTVDITDTDTLDDIVTKINEANVGVAASIINDGSGVRPYRLSLTSMHSGVDGRFLFDDGGLGITTSTLSQGRDAVVLFGSSDPADALMITSGKNKLTDTIAGVTIDLKGTSSSPVTINIARDEGKVVSSVAKFVESYNKVLDTLDKYDNYDAETEQRGLLLGDNTVSQVRSRLLSSVNARQLNVGGQYEFLTQIGLNIRDGARLRFDETKFADALANDPDAVRKLFSATTSVANTSTTDVDLPDGVTIPVTEGSTIKPVGFAQKFIDVVKSLTDSVSGTLTNRTDTIDRQIEQANDRITQLTELLASKRARLEQQFAAMETALAKLQDQSASLAGLQNIAAQTSQNRN